MSDALYLDSNVFVYAALYEGEKADGAAELLRRVVEGDAKAATASLTFDEVMWVLSQEASREVALRQADRLLGFADLRVLGIDSEDVGEAIGVMRSEGGLSPRDAFHVTSAKRAGIDTVVTNDGDFEGVEGVDVLGLEEV